jgi:hypothetical protein
MKLKPVLSLTQLVTLTLFSSLAMTCSSKGPPPTPAQLAEKQQKIFRDAGKGLAIAAEGVSAGIDTVRAFREGGEITPQKSLELAHVALDANSVMAESVDFLLAEESLEDADKGKLLSQFSRVLDSARRLKDSGTLHIKSGKSKLIFDLGITAGKSGLVIAVDQMGGGPTGLPILIDGETRDRLKRTRETLISNDKRLREAIARLSQM